MCPNPNHIMTNNFILHRYHQILCWSLHQYFLLGFNNKNILHIWASHQIYALKLGKTRISKFPVHLHGCLYGVRVRTRRVPRQQKITYAFDCTVYSKLSYIGTNKSSFSRNTKKRTCAWTEHNTLHSWAREEGNKDTNALSECTKQS